MNRKNKKGFLLAEETLKMIIAVIAIGFLIYFLTSIYLKSQESKDLELAKASLEHLVSEIEAGQEQVEIYNPKGWVISSWPHDTIKSRLLYSTEIKDDMPMFCKNLNWNSCLCICDDAINFEGADCDDSGICMEREIEIISKPTEGIVKISPPLELEINGGNIIRR